MRKPKPGRQPGMLADAVCCRICMKRRQVTAAKDTVLQVRPGVCALCAGPGVVSAPHGGVPARLPRHKGVRDPRRRLQQRHHEVRGWGIALTLTPTPTPTPTLS